MRTVYLGLALQGHRVLAVGSFRTLDTRSPNMDYCTNLLDMQSPVKMQKLDMIKF